MKAFSLHQLGYHFSRKPVLVGGMAMEYYGIRKSGRDIDLIAHQEDIAALIRQYPKRVKNLWGDLGVCPMEFEIWRTINYADYNYYKESAVELEEVLVIAKEKLLIMKALAMNKEKYMNDLRLIVNGIIKEQGSKYKEIQSQNDALLKGLAVEYIEKKFIQD